MRETSWKALIFSTVLVFFFLSAASLQAKKFEGLELAQKVTFNQHELTLNGVGMRTKYNIIDVYAGALYLSMEKDFSSSGSKDLAENILQSDKPMAIRMIIVTGMLTKKKLVTSLKSGIKKSTQGDTEQFEEQIDKLISSGFNQIEEINEADVLDLVYLPEKGIQIYENSNHIATVKSGVAFKKALFGVWIGDNPAQESLKKAMLGK